MKAYTPYIRIVSANHEKTVAASQLLAHAMKKHNLPYRINDVFCHLETSRCGLTADQIGVEVDGQFIFIGSSMTDKLAESFCAGLPAYIEKQKRELGLL